jgi:hypothetical protein
MGRHKDSMIYKDLQRKKKTVMIITCPASCEVKCLIIRYRVLGFSHPSYWTFLSTSVRTCAPTRPSNVDKDQTVPLLIYFVLFATCQILGRQFAYLTITGNKLVTDQTVPGSRQFWSGVRHSSQFKFTILCIISDNGDENYAVGSIYTCRAIFVTKNVSQKVSQSCLWRRDHTSKCVCPSKWWRWSVTGP